MYLGCISPILSSFMGVFFFFVSLSVQLSELYVDRWIPACSSASTRQLIIDKPLHFTGATLPKEERQRGNTVHSAGWNMGSYGAPFSSVGRAGIPGTDALSSFESRLGALCCVSLPLSHPVSCLVFSCTINDTLQSPKKYLINTYKNEL